MGLAVHLFDACLRLVFWVLGVVPARKVFVEVATSSPLSMHSLSWLRVRVCAITFFFVLLTFVTEVLGKRGQVFQLQIPIGFGLWGWGERKRERVGFEVVLGLGIRVTLCSVPGRAWEDGLVGS